MSVDSESSIQKVDSDDSVVACQQDAADFFDSIGQKRTCAQQKILEALVVLADQKSPIIAVRLGFIWRMPE